MVFLLVADIWMIGVAGKGKGAHAKSAMAGEFVLIPSKLLVFRLRFRQSITGKNRHNLEPLRAGCFYD